MRRVPEAARDASTALSDEHVPVLMRDGMRAGRGPARSAKICVQTGKALGSLSRKIEEAVGRANEDREWVDKVWSVSTIVENAARRERINGRIACEEAREEGRQEGRQEGLEEGSARFAALASRLHRGRPRDDDLAQAASDPVRRDELFREFDL